MKCLVLFAAVAVVILEGAEVAAAAELPTYKSMDLPITALQISVVVSTHVQEVTSVPTLTVGGMPASLRQIAVLTMSKNFLDQRGHFRRDGSASLVHTLI
jgi:hypothetical protein